MRSLIALLLLLVPVSFLQAATGDNPGLWLGNGKNEVKITIVNVWNRDLEGLTLEFAKESLPEWIEIDETVQFFDLPRTNSNSKTLVLNFNLKDAPEGEIAELFLVLKDRNGNRWNFSTTVHVGSGTTALPKAFSLSQNSPNPFNPSTTISYDVPEGKKIQISIKVYDIRGRLIRTLVNEEKEAGSYNVFWDGTDQNGRQISSGVYFYRMAAGEFEQTRKMVMIK